MWGIFAVVALTAIAAAAILSWTRKPIVAELDSYRAEIGPELAQYVAAVNSENDRSSQPYLRAVAALRSAPEKVVAEAGRHLADDSDAPFAIRHSILLALGDLGDPAALDLLSRVALNPQPLPPVDDGRRHAGSEIDCAYGFATGTLLALDALDGIEALADAGVAAAGEILVEAAGVDSNAVRAEALAALAARPERRDLFERASRRLPAELRHLAQMRRVPVAEIPRVRDPRVHLTGAEFRGVGPPHLGSDASPPAQPGRSRGAPQIRGRA
jgi:HEAT repeat protein